MGISVKGGRGGTRNFIRDVLRTGWLEPPSSSTLSPAFRDDRACLGREGADCGGGDEALRFLGVDLVSLRDFRDGFVVGAGFFDAGLLAELGFLAV